MFDAIKEAQQMRAENIRRWLSRIAEYSIRFLAGLNQQMSFYQKQEPAFTAVSSVCGPEMVRRTTYKNGKISCDLESTDDEIVIEESAKFYGTLKARKVILKGLYDGMIVCEEGHFYGHCTGRNALALKMFVYSGAVLEGEFSFSPGQLVIHPGATINAVLDPYDSPDSVSIMPFLHPTEVPVPDEPELNDGDDDLNPSESEFSPLDMDQSESDVPISEEEQGMIEDLFPTEK